jgi:hypothetical protein
VTVALRHAGAPPARRRAVVAAGGAVAVAVVAAAGALLAGSGPGAAPLTGGAASGDDPSGVPTEYVVTYEVTFEDGATHAERIAVSRPFRSEVRSGDTARISDAGVLATAGGDGSWLSIEVPIAPATADLRPDAVLADAVAAGHVEVRGRHRVAGTTCQEHRFGGPVASGSLTPVGTTPGEHADVCIDDRGLVLRERWVLHGRLVRERTATDVSVGRARVGDVPAEARHLSPEAGGGAVEAVAADHDPGFDERWSVDVPAELSHVGRWLVVPPARERPDPGHPRPTEVALVTDAWQRGADLVLLDQGATLPGVDPPWDDRPAATTVDLGAAGTAEVVWDLRATEVRIQRPDGGFVRLAGTLPPDELVAIARTLAPDRGDRP